MNETSDIYSERSAKLEQYKNSGKQPYPYDYNVTISAADLQKKYQKLATEQKTSDEVSVAGRIMLKRWMGSVMFMTIADQSSTIQLYFSRSDLQEFNQARTLLDIGDIVGVRGTVFRTKRGELSVWVSEFDLLAKSLTGLADKHHGLKNIETKYRNRSLDMVMDPQVRKIITQRYEITRSIRNFMEKEGFLEVETPITQTHYGGAAAKPFLTHHEKLDMDMYLRVSPEQNLKRLLAGGFEAIFEIGKSFRNENIDRTHNPEFTMLEAYRAYKNYEYSMDLLERLIEYICAEVLKKDKFEYDGHSFSFDRPWQRLSVYDALAEYANINVEKESDKQIFARVEKLEKELPDKTRGDAILLLFEEYCEEKIIVPTHVIGYPKQSTPFAKLDRNNPDLIERFESFIVGREVANAYSELNDPILQRDLLQTQQNKKTEADETWGDMDEEFIEAMELGMPPATGIGVGIDRLSMLLLNQPSIRDIIFFPTMKPKD